MKQEVLVVNLDYSGWPEWPVGMAYVLACLEKHGVPFDFVDCTTTDNHDKVLRNKLSRGEKYLAVLSGGLIGYYRAFRSMVRMVKDLAPGTPFVLGGHIVKDGNDKLLFETIGVDYGILGEAEASLGPFLHALAKGETDFTNYTGVFFKDSSGSIIRNRMQRVDLSGENILPAWHHFDVEFYTSHSGFAYMGKNLRYMPVLSGRGCIGKCGFCSPSVGGFKKRPIPHVLGEIEFLIDNFDFDTVCFLNEMFYPRVREIREFCHAYMKLEKRKDWFVQVRVDADLDVETITLMKEAGCIAISAGIESGSDKILKLMNKKSTVKQIRQHFRNCREAGMPANGTVIIGYDGEAESDMKKTFDLLIEEDIPSGEALLFAYQGTPVYEKACNIGLIADEDKHLDAISGNLFRANVTEEFCNLTAMSDEEFFRVAPREVRRYNSHLFQNYPVDDLRITVDGSWRWTRVSMSGRCTKCGEPIEHAFMAAGGEFMGSLGPGVNRMIACRKCFRPTVFDPYGAVNFPDMQEHLECLREALRKNNGVAVVGINDNLDFLLRSDCYGLDYEAIKGVYPLRPFHLSKYMVYPVLDGEQLVNSGAGLVLCMDDTVKASAIRLLYERQGRPVPEVMHLTSTGFRRIFRDRLCLVHKVNQMSKKVFGMTARELVAKVVPGR